ncbi:MAG: crossover junction endodeoxyribonuclease RuvC [Elusimicrobia bacterium]|nr:crossover junction endodeoxyribonuclease RuvC [Elusimicrobiota bacterium]
MKIMGVDPGTHIMGWGFIEGDRAKLRRRRWGVIKPKRKDDLSKRLKFLYDKISEIMTEIAPDAVSCEEPFFFKDIRAAVNLARAQAIVSLAAIQRGLIFKTYSPLEVKKATVGYGRATKFQVSEQMKRILKISGEIPEDATDALACAFCFISDMRNYSPQKK